MGKGVTAGKLALNKSDALDIDVDPAIREDPLTAGIY